MAPDRPFHDAIARGEPLEAMREFRKLCDDNAQAELTDMLNRLEGRLKQISKELNNHFITRDIAKTNGTSCSSNLL